MPNRAAQRAPAPTPGQRMALAAPQPELQCVHENDVADAILGSLKQAGLDAEAEEFLANALNNPASPADLAGAVRAGEEIPQTKEEIRARWDRYALFAQRTFNVEIPEIPYEHLENLDDGYAPRLHVATTSFPHRSHIVRSPPHVSVARTRPPR